MRPKPRSFMSGKAARTRMSGARTKIAMKPSQISGVSSSIPGARASASGRTLLMPMPALLMTASIAPKRARAAAMAAAQPFAPARSARMGSRRSLVFACRAESRSSALASRSTAATQWPAANSASVIATPMPPAAPVRKTMRLCADVMIVSRPEAYWPKPPIVEYGARIEDELRGLDVRFEDLRRRPHARVSRLVDRRRAAARLPARPGRDRRGRCAQPEVFSAQSQRPAAAHRRRRFRRLGVAGDHALSRQEIFAWRTLSRRARRRGAPLAVEFLGSLRGRSRRQYLVAACGSLAAG